MSALAVSSQMLQRLSPVWVHYTDLEVDRGEGVYLFTRDGRRLLDFTSGIGVTNTGHCHPRIVAALQHQAARLLHAQATIVYSTPLLELVQELSTVVPSELDCFFFTNSGTEAVESALKLARHATGRPNFIAFQGGYHGRTVGAMAITTARAVYRTRYQPLMAGVCIAPFPYLFRYGQEPDALVDWCLRELRFILQTETAPEETAAMIVEPVLGEGGYVVPPRGFLTGLRDICDEHGILLIVDEVQTGFGRTGRFFALEHFAVQPDILVMAKGLASGLPMSGIVAPRSLMERWLPGSHGGTYGGNPLAAAAASETIRVLRDERLVERAAELGPWLMTRLQALKPSYRSLGDVRGLGLMVGCEFVGQSGQPNPALADLVRRLCLEEGFLLLLCGSHNQVVRWIPPLVVTQPQLDEALTIFGRALERATEQAQLTS